MLVELLVAVAGYILVVSSISSTLISADNIWLCVEALKLSNLIPLSEVLAEGVLATSSMGSSLIFEQKPSLDPICVEEQRYGDDADEYDDSDELQNDGSNDAHLLKVLL